MSPRESNVCRYHMEIQHHFRSAHAPNTETTLEMERSLLGKTNIFENWHQWKNSKCICLKIHTYYLQIDAALLEGAHALEQVISKGFSESSNCFNTMQKYKHIRLQTLPVWCHALRFLDLVAVPSLVSLICLNRKISRFSDHSY